MLDLFNQEITEFIGRFEDGTASLIIFVFGVFALFLPSLLSAWLVYFFGIRRDNLQKKSELDYESEVAARQIRRAKLLEAYHLIDSGLPDRLEFLQLPSEQHMERAASYTRGLGLVKLFGDEDLSSDIDRLIDNFNKGKSDFSIDIFMNKLRDSVRKDHGLQITSARYKWLDVKPVIKN